MAKNAFMFRTGNLTHYLLVTGMERESEHTLRSLIRETIAGEYRNALLEMEFQAIFGGLNVLAEAGNWTGPNTYEWEPEPKKGTPDEPPLTFQWDVDTSNPKGNIAGEIAKKTKAFLEKLPKDRIQEYFGKFLEKIKNLPQRLRRDIMVATASAFLTVASMASLTGPAGNTVDPKMAQEFKEVVQDAGNPESQEQDAQTPSKDRTQSKTRQNTKKSSFQQAQSHVKISEAGYSDDRKDNGNWVNIKGYGKRFVGSKYGISAPVLAKYMGRLPKAEDMRDLSYATALKIYKRNYWDANNLTHFSNQSVANILYDGCVNQGTYGTKETMRNALNSMGVKISGSEDPFSPNWIKTANALNQESLFNAVKTHRGKRYRESDTFAVHGKGWMNRLSSLEFDPST